MIVSLLYVIYCGMSWHKVAMIWRGIALERTNQLEKQNLEFTRYKIGMTILFIESYLKESPFKYLQLDKICVKMNAKGEVDIAIGDNDRMLRVDYHDFTVDPSAAIDDTCRRWQESTP